SARSLQCLISKRVAATFCYWLAVSAEDEIHQCHIECSLCGRGLLTRPYIDFISLMATLSWETLFVMVVTLSPCIATLRLVAEMLVQGQAGCLPCPLGGGWGRQGAASIRARCLPHGGIGINTLP